ncbi:MAG TPA: phospholipase D-like domain-containing protein, partial [Longimicrobium sp.]|nr:phospholipase D-like domain-containing protein [Longimicrobium sp.]
MSEFVSWPWWVTLFGVIGVAATVSVIVSLFFALGRRPRRFKIYVRPEVGSEPFLQGISGMVNAPLQEGGTARLLNNGVEIFPALLDALRGAERSINFMTYIWEPGKASDAILDVLEERARAGVHVRVMLDAMGAWGAPKERFERLEAAGGRVRWFQALRLGKLTGFYKRNHRRAIVVDGKVGFTGGASVADKWLGDAENEEHWRDIMVEMRGCLAANLQSAFIQLWTNTTGEVLIGDDFFPPADQQERDEPSLSVTRHVNVISSPAQASHPLRMFFWTSFACARKSIYLTSAYFAPDDETRKVLAERARAGLDVRLLLPNSHTDAKVVRWAGHAYYRELLEAGVRIYEYQTTMIHSKTVVVDGTWSIVGSANMDIRSKELNQ